MNKGDWQALGGIVLFYAVLEALGVTCPIRFLTGVSCPGCGMSRAWLALLRLDWEAAYAFHPLFWLPVPGGALLLFRRKVPPWLFRLGLALAGGLFAAVYLRRLFSPEDLVVVFRPRDGLLCRLLSELRDLL